MGNCLRHHRQSSATRWEEEDWGVFEESEPCGKMGSRKGEEENLLGEKQRVPSTEVKIKISKKQLEELLGRADVQGMSIEQILAQLISVDGELQLRHRHWKPALQSIPEID
ncbi:hypothetical protein H6P81_006951 [Aristolochia fimbriata]|uniref:Uncharacterized protein n=1 Tax=Aristolochia fimbriata TaxID=158543 RepID=A0AAV7F272_ARIFI|nr:hypothetical protein H6P81_006951 [Aristolochia fimbriata]